MPESELPATGSNRRTIHSTCRVHNNGRGYCNLRLTKIDGNIVLDPHVDDSCVIILDENEATAVRDTLTEWLDWPKTCAQCGGRDTRENKAMGA